MRHPEQVADRHKNAPVLLRSPRFHLQLLLVTALLLGGGGVAYGLRNLAIQLLALALLAAHQGHVLRFVQQAPLGLRLLVLASLAIPLLHLIPLPSAIWSALPGRDAALQSLALVGAADSWRPLSLDPARTLVAFCGTLAPAAIIVIGSGMSRNDQLILAKTVLALAVAAFALGAIQLLSGNAFALFFDERPRPDVLYSAFANRNSTALLFVIALALLAGLPWPRRREWRWLWSGGAALLFLAVVLTQSRSGMALLSFPLLLAVARLALRGRLHKSSAHSRKWALVGAAAALGVLTVSGAVLTQSETRIAASLERFSGGAADRPEMWEDAVFAARVYAPVGSGMGTFDEVFQLHESLEHVSPRKAGRAHSDWLEIGVEGGLAALLVAGGWVVWIVLACVPKGSLEGIWLRLAAGAGLAAIILQSLLDYPLRNQTLLCFAACLVMLLIGRGQVRQ